MYVTWSLWRNMSFNCGILHLLSSSRMLWHEAQVSQQRWCVTHTANLRLLFGQLGRWRGVSLAPLLLGSLFCGSFLQAQLLGFSVGLHQALSKGRLAS